MEILDLYIILCRRLINTTIKLYLFRVIISYMAIEIGSSSSETIEIKWCYLGFHSSAIPYIFLLFSAFRIKNRNVCM